MHVECRRLLEGGVRERRARAQAHAHQRGGHGIVTGTTQNSRKTVLGRSRSGDGPTSERAWIWVSGCVVLDGTFGLDGVAGEGRDDL